MPRAPPSTGKKREMTRRVFGMSTIDENETSLCYSVSPSKSEVSSINRSSEASNESTNNKSTNSSTTIDPFERIVNKENVANSPAKGYSEYRMQGRSPLRPDLVKKTQDAINKATISINNSLNNVRKARHKAQRFKSKTTALVRDEWKEDAEKARSMQQEIQKNRQEILNLHKQLASQNSREKARRNQISRMKMVQEIDEEAKFKSKVYREHQDTLREEAARKRRHSAAVKAKIRENHRVGEQKLRMHEAEEVQAIVDERHAAVQASMQSQKEYFDSRRKSFAFRNGDARRIRELHARMESDRLQKQHESFELKRQAEKDAEAYKRKLEEDRRLSLAARNLEARKQRNEEMMRQSRKAASEHESYELKRLADKDVDEYKHEMEKERRESLANRNREGLRQRQLAGDMEAANRAKEHESYELKWAGERDALEYQKQCEDARRQSLALRNQEGRRIRNLESQLRSESQAAESQSYNLKWDGERDAEEYKRRMKEEARQSLELRNKEGRRIRNFEEQTRSQELQARHESHELKWAGERDAEDYKRQLAREEREDLAFRNKERRKHAQVMEELRAIAHEQEVESLVLKWAGEKDAQEYLLRVERERRESLQFRGKETVRHRQIENDLKCQELASQHEDERLRAEGHRDMEEYRKKCAARDRASLEYRRKEAHKQRLEEAERKSQQMKKEEELAELDHLAHCDVQDYIKDCKMRRRMSLAVRAKEKRQHSQWRLEEKERSLASRRNEVSGRLLDQHYIELARQRERAKIAMDAIKHSKCSFNPFLGVL